MSSSTSACQQYAQRALRYARRRAFSQFERYESQKDQCRLPEAALQLVCSRSLNLNLPVRWTDEITRNSCALTLKPVETPVCTPEGIVFELLAIIPWLKEHGTNPVTGKALGPGELIKIQFHFNSDGEFLLLLFAFFWVCSTILMLSVVR